jgi:RNA recognition motif-containing protein
VCDIPLATREEDLRHIFGQHGRIDAIRIVPRETFVLAFVTMGSVQEADACIRSLNNTPLFQGEKPMKVRA